MGSLRLPGRSATPTTMLWLKTLTVLYKNELTNTRSFNNATDLEIAMFEWVNWWNDSRLHQSLGYRTPAEVEAEFWSYSPVHEIMNIRAHA
ncbi:integrase core domain-containing protein [Corynebacterium urogenitale]